MSKTLPAPQDAQAGVGGVNGHTGFVTFSDVRDARVALNVKCPGGPGDSGAPVRGQGGAKNFHKVREWGLNECLICF